MNNFRTITNVAVRSSTFTGSSLDLMEKKVNRLVDQGYSAMAIMHFLGQSYSVSGVLEDGIFVINVN